MLLTKQEFIKLVDTESKQRQWFTWELTVQDKAVRIRAYGMWIHYMQVSGCSFYVDIPECKTHKEFRVTLAEALTACGIPD